MSAQELLEQAKALPPAAQVALVEALQDELDRPDPAVDAAWAAEARDRLVAYRQGRIKAIPLEQVLARHTTSTPTLTLL